jgi:hypothetical protein
LCPSPGDVSLKKIGSHLPLTDLSPGDGYLYVFRLSWVLISTAADITLVTCVRATGTAITLLVGDAAAAGAVTPIGLAGTDVAVIAPEEILIANLSATITLLIAPVVTDSAVITPVKVLTAGDNAGRILVGIKALSYGRGLHLNQLHFFQAELQVSLQPLPLLQEPPMLLLQKLLFCLTGVI